MKHASEWERDFRERVKRGEKPDRFVKGRDESITRYARKKAPVWSGWMTVVPPPKNRNRRGRGPDA